MPDIDKKILASSCEVRTFKSGEAFLKKGKADENVYIIRDGAVYVTDSSGNQRRLKQGGIFGGKSRRAAGQAERSCQLKKAA